MAHHLRLAACQSVVRLLYIKRMLCCQRCEEVSYPESEAIGVVGKCLSRQWAVGV